MAGTSLLVLLDDIASVLDDVALMTKVAAQKTAGVLGDDLALNARQVAGVRAERELPVVWAVMKGSFKNKLILAPAALAISWVASWLIMPLLTVGGLYLCFEGFEKLACHALPGASGKDSTRDVETAAMAAHVTDLAELERQKIRGAIRTDFVLSAEIIVIALGTVATAGFAMQVAVIAGIALIMTVGVYGLVAGIVKLDDLGLYLCGKSGSGLWSEARNAVGMTLLRAAPYLMKTLSVVGAAAMFLVGGGIVAHAIPPIAHVVEAAAESGGSMPVLGSAVGMLAYPLLNGLVGIACGALSWTVVKKVGPMCRPAETKG